MAKTETKNEIALIDDSVLNAFAAEMGASTEELNGGGGNFLPALKVWFEDDEEDGQRLKGKLYVTGQEVLVYAKPGTVVFQPLTHTFQWTQWDDTAKKTTNRTRLIYNFKEEGRDEKGTIRCGKPPSKDLKDNKALQKKYEDITTYRRIQGLVSYEGIDKDGKEHKVENLLVGLNLKGSNFNPFQDEFIVKMPAKSNLWDWKATINLSREKNEAVTYYVLHYIPDFGNRIPMSAEVFETLKALKAEIDKFNKSVDKKYYDAIHGNESDDRESEALDLEADLNDDIPFE